MSSIFMNFRCLTVFDAHFAYLDIQGARISVSDETLTIVAKNQSVMDKVQEKVCFNCKLYQIINLVTFFF